MSEWVWLYVSGLTLASAFWTAEVQMTPYDDAFHRARIFRDNNVASAYKVVKFFTLWVGGTMAYLSTFGLTVISGFAFLLFIYATKLSIWLLGNVFGYFYWKFYHIFSFMIPLDWLIENNNVKRSRSEVPD